MGELRESLKSVSPKVWRLVVFKGSLVGRGLGKECC